MRRSMAKNNNPAFKHGHAVRGCHSNIYRRWTHMISRCQSPNDCDYQRYGARGIVVCDEWREFAVFLADMGTPADTTWSLDRIDNNGPYSKENCRWATPQQQASNRRNAVRLTIRGITRPIAEWSALVGISRHAIKHRLNHQGMTHEEAVYKPLVWTKTKP